MGNSLFSLRSKFSGNKSNIKKTNQTGLINALTNLIKKNLNAIQNFTEHAISTPQLHLRAEAYKHLCLTADRIATQSNRQNCEFSQFVNGYRVIRTEFDPGTNFKAVTYQKNNELVNCFVGTDPKNIKDHKTNIWMGMGKATKQMRQASNYTKDICEKYGRYNKIVNAGHSEGGSEAIFSGLFNEVEIFTFNAFALSSKILTLIERENGRKNNTSLIRNYRNPHDPISKLFNKDTGKTYIVPNQQTKFMAKTPFGLREAHALKMMGNCKDAIPIAKYKTENKWFIDKIGLVKLTVEDINEIAQAGLFGLYEDEIDNRLKKV